MYRVPVRAIYNILYTVYTSPYDYSVRLYDIIVCIIYHISYVWIAFPNFDGLIEGPNTLDLRFGCFATHHPRSQLPRTKVAHVGQK